MPGGEERDPMSANPVPDGLGQTCCPVRLTVAGRFATEMSRHPVPRQISHFLTDSLYKPYVTFLLHNRKGFPLVPSKYESRPITAILREDEEKLEFLRSLSETCRRGRWPTLEDLDTLIDICRDPRDPMRETALTLLLSPPLRDASGYMSWLLGQFPKIFSKPHRMPLELLEQVLEVVGFLESVPDVLKAGGWWSKLVRILPPAGFRWLFTRPLPLEPFADALWTPATARWFGSKHQKGIGRRQWQLLGRCLRRVAEGGPWATVTTMDLGRLFRGAAPSQRPLVGRGRCRRIVGALVTAPAPQPTVSGSAPHLSTAIKYWNGCGQQTLEYLDALLRWQAEELRRVRDLSQRLSTRTGQVVLSCHNATLAAASGWGLPMMHEYFLNGESWNSFESTVTRMSLEDRWVSGEQSLLMEQLRVLYEERLIHPTIRQAFGESRQRALLAGFTGSPDGDSNLEPFRSFLPSQLFEELHSSADQGWTGTLSPHQRIHLSDVMAWGDAHRASWVSGVRLLTAAIREGQRLLDAGELQQLVIPWIEKFFISSRRDQDLDLFPLIVRCLELYGCRPLMLFWEDTSHAAFPSLQLALRHWRDAGLACRGIGVFSDGLPVVDRERAEEFIAAHHTDTRWFALRPFGDGFRPRSLEQLLGRRDYAFLNAAAYDSSWKDNLAFIYAGTQVAPLVSVQCDAELFPAWVVVNGRKWPFGAFLRRVLRRMVLGHEDERLAREGLAGRYAEWANLL
jgi:hypothetical protein